ncbi:MAG: T9SS type A sorting domain-containing protein, partial [Bacteroidota bacterium]
ISKLDPSGNFQWALPFGGPLSERGSAIVTDPFGYIYSTGYFNDVVDFDPGAGILNFTSLGGEDVYISKLDGAAVSAMKENTAINFNLFPNPTCGKITIDLQEHFYSAAISVNNIIGQQIFSKKYSSGNNIYLNLEKEEAGVYFVELKVDDKASVIQKIIKQ